MSATTHGITRRTRLERIPRLYMVPSPSRHTVLSSSMLYDEAY